MSDNGPVVTYGNPLFECAGAHIRALSRQVATVVSVSGTIDRANLDRVTAFVRRFVLAEKSFVLDLSDIDAIAAQSASLLGAVAAACERAGVEWALIAGAPVNALLDRAEQVTDMPVIGSVPEALQYFADSAARRRSMLLPLLTKTA
ncbi:MAG: STAS domain-containing protein [Mycobacterium sp.]|nr:STAS domain-containing protein [Mycobacterium sp.]